MSKPRYLPKWAWDDSQYGQMLSGRGFVAALVGAILSAFLLIATVGVSLDYSSCRQLQERTGYDTSYRVLTGCYITLNGRSIPASRWIHNTGN